jgi:hypothetical protein
MAVGVVAGARTVPDTGAVAHAPTAQAGPLALDQEQLSFSGGLSVQAGASQTIIAGRSGLLVRVDLPLCTFARGSSVLLRISGPGGRATASVTASQSQSDCLWQRFVFARPMAVRRGQGLRLTLTRLMGQAPLWAWHGERGDPYRRGFGTWQGHRIDDYAFRTYVWLE